MLDMGRNLVMKKRHREAHAGMQATIIETLSSMMLVCAEQMLTKKMMGEMLT